MLLTKAQLRAHLMTSDDETRPNIGHLRIDPDGKVSATNGHIAVVVTPKGQQKIEEAEFPPIPGLEGENPVIPVYLSREAAATAVRIAPGGSVSATTHARMLVNDKIVLGATDLQTPQLVVADRPVIDNFPNVEQSIPVGPYGITVTIQAKYLALIAKYAAAFDQAPYPSVTLTVYAPDQAVRVRWSDEYHDVDGAIMPIRAYEPPAPKDEAAEPPAPEPATLPIETQDVEL